MSRIITETQPHTENRRQALTALLTQPAMSPATMSTSTSLIPSPRTTQRIARLERQAPQVVKDANKIGVDLDALGTHLLFNETRLYAGINTDWTLQPVREADDAVIPKREREIIQRLDESGVADFSALYIAHETKDRAKDLVALGDSPIAVDRSMATDLVGPIPEPHQALELAERLGQRAEQVMLGAARTALKAARVAGAAAAGVAALPALALGGIAAMTVDPIILGAVPAGALNVGEPAFFYVIAKWDW